MEFPVLASPLAIMIGKKRHALNLNYYRNAHFQTLNKIKVAYALKMAKAISDLPVFNEPISITYTFYAPTKGRYDLGNVCSVHDKFFADALVSQGKIKDDTCTHIPEIQFEFGGVDRQNPRVDIKVHLTQAQIAAKLRVVSLRNPQIIFTEKRNGTMQLSLSKAEVKAALAGYFQNILHPSLHMEATDMDFTSARSDDGIAVTVTLVPVNTVDTSIPEVSDNKPEPVTPPIITHAKPEPVEEPVEAPEEPEEAPESPSEEKAPEPVKEVAATPNLDFI